MKSKILIGILLVSLVVITGCSSTEQTTVAKTDTDTQETTFADTFQCDYKLSGKSWEGQDVNENGIWDHAEAFIEEKSAGSEKVKSAFEQLACSIQLSMQDVNSTEKSIENYHETSRAGQCLFYVGGPESFLISDLTQAILNTKERAEQYLSFGTKYGLEIENVEVVGKEGCKFNPD